MPFTIVRNDITKVTADAIVNTANPHAMYAEGTDRAIYEAAGAEALLAVRRKIGDIARGDAVATPAFALHAKHIIHTVGPVWHDGTEGEFETLASCYRKSLELAESLHCESIAFPLIATGIYGFPKDQALSIALREFNDFLLHHDMQITLVVFSKEAFALSGKLFEGIQEQMDELAYQKKLRSEYDGAPGNFRSRRVLEELDACEAPMMSRPEPDEQPLKEPGYPMLGALATCAPVMHSFDDEDVNKDIEALLMEKQETFQQCLFRLIDERKLKDSEVYRRANVSRQHFSKIRSSVNYAPTKKTAVALAIGLHLTMDETMDLISRAGFTIGRASKFDVIIRYFIENQHYDIPDINCAIMFHCGEKEQLK